MDGEFLSDSPSPSDGTKVKVNNASYTDTFYELFPTYLAMGMTYELYWDGDPDLPKYYRRAKEIRNEERNEELWLQGMYIYEALCDVSPIMHGFAKKGTRPHPYAENPYPLSSKEKERVERAKERKVRDKGLKIMEAFMAQTNRKFGETEQKTE